MKKLFVIIAALGLAAAVAAAQDFNAAVDTFNAGAQALEAGNKADAVTQFRSALAQFKACEEAEAAEMVTKCKEIIPNTLLSIAKEQINNAEYDAAVASLKETVTTAGEMEAAEVAEEATKLIPNVFTRKAATLLKAKDFAGAAEAAKEVVALNPEDGQAYLMLGQSLMQTGDMDGAVAALDNAAQFGKADQANKLNSTIFLKKGQALLKAGKNAEAIEALTKSNEYLESANAYKLMASALTKSGKSKDAIGAYKKYLEVAPDAKDKSDILFTIAATAQKAGDKATAIEYYNQLTSDAKYKDQAAAQLKTLK
jgi:tetratricopeptide (TPR) repeat protein